MLSALCAMRLLRGGANSGGGDQILVNILGLDLSLFSKREWVFVFRPLRLTLYGLRSRVNAMPYALCAMRDVEVAMPAIASIEDLRAAQKDLLETKENDDL
jgi:hypothetical protein